MNGLAISNRTATCAAEIMACFGMKDIKTMDLPRILPERTAAAAREATEIDVNKELTVNRMMAFGNSLAGGLY